MRTFKLKIKTYLDKYKSRTLHIEFKTIKENEQVIFEEAKEYVRANYGRADILSMTEVK
jgi:hypothetical protein